jgi:heme oxygenase
MMAALTLVLAYRVPTTPSCPQTVRSRSAVLSLTDQEERISQVMELPTAEKLTGSSRGSGLALALDDGTRKSHSVAENTAFVTGFFRGIATKQSFGQLVTTLYFVYEAMESAFDESTDPCVQALDYQVLRRLPALEEDMAYFHGPQWRVTVAPSTATKKYAARIREVATEAPHLLVAHMYTRYLGDLFGGQMMGGMARRSMGLEEAKGTAFYEFDDIEATKPFIEEWYTKLNLLELTDAQKQAIVDEGNLVFALNIEVFEELEGNPAQALWTLAAASLRSALGLKD